MSEGIRMALTTAERVAEEIQTLLGPTCQRLVVAGSVRRQKSLVGDIEMVIEPSYTPITEQITLFDTHTIQRCDLETKVQELASAGLLRPRYREDGVILSYPKSFENKSKYLALWYGADPAEQIKLDLFICRPERLHWWGWLLALRTGPGECNRLLVQGPKLGLWVQQNADSKRYLQGLLPPGVIVGGRGYEGTVYKFGGTPIPLETEQAVFETWQMTYVEPQQRTPLAYVEARHQWKRLNP